jgi:hypothetical protein
MMRGQSSDNIEEVKKTERPFLKLKRFPQMPKEHNSGEIDVSKLPASAIDNAYIPKRSFTKASAEDFVDEIPSQLAQAMQRYGISKVTRGTSSNNNDSYNKTKSSGTSMDQ